MQFLPSKRSQCSVWLSSTSQTKFGSQFTAFVMCQQRTGRSYLPIVITYADVFQFTLKSVHHFIHGHIAVQHVATRSQGKPLPVLWACGCISLGRCGGGIGTFGRRWDFRLIADPWYRLRNLCSCRVRCPYSELEGPQSSLAGYFSRASASSLSTYLLSARAQVHLYIFIGRGAGVGWGKLGSNPWRAHNPAWINSSCLICVNNITVLGPHGCWALS